MEKSAVILGLSRQAKFLGLPMPYVKRRSDVVGIFPNEASIMRLIGAVLFEANDDWQISSRYMMVEAFAQIDNEEIDPILSITTKEARP